MPRPIAQLPKDATLPAHEALDAKMTLETVDLLRMVSRLLCEQLPVMDDIRNALSAVRRIIALLDVVATGPTAALFSLDQADIARCEGMSMHAVRFQLSHTLVPVREPEPPSRPGSR